MNFADCDTVVGCETDITTPSNCGTCGKVCGAICSKAACINATAIAGGYSQFCALMTDQSVYCWGQNQYGEVGDGTTTNRSNPVKVTLPQPASAISAGGLYTGLASIPYSAHSCARLVSGAITCWGSNSNGELGVGDTAQHAGPQPITSFPAAVSIVEVAAGGAMTCAITNSSALYCWGANNAGQVGNGLSVPLSMGGVTTPTVIISGGVKHVAVGGFHTCVIKADDSLYCWGQNSFGQLGDSTQNGTKQPGAAVPGLSGVLEVVAGHWSTCARTATAVYCWGFNGGGELGDGTLTDQHSPEQIQALSGATQLTMGENHAGAITASGTFMWGKDSEGELGDGMMVSSVPTPEAVSALSNLTMLKLSRISSCGLTMGGQVLCWGYNGFGELGSGDTTVVTSATPSPVVWQ
jgi:alpha-tubulin suppressor-like RCC1 family protein